MSTTSPPAAPAGTTQGSWPVERNNGRGLVKAMRPRQWVKSTVVYAALVFDGKLFEPGLFVATTLVFLAFCLLSSAVYMLNDLVDIEKDRQHPRKRFRPLASGQLDPRVAVVAATVFALVSLIVGFWLSLWVGVILVAYIAQNVAYSFWLKNIVIVDVMMLALGFLLRVAAGVAIVQPGNFSPWLYVCVTLLALFLGFGKRRQEIVLLEENAGNHRSSLLEYNVPLLDQLIGMVTTATLVVYTFYSFDATTALAHSKMLLTVPFVFYFLARYLYLVHVKHLGGAPDELLLEDKALLVNSALWAAAVVAIIYWWT